MSQEILDQLNTPSDVRTINYLAVPGGLTVQGTASGISGFTTAYFVDGTRGNDSNDGRTINTPYLTMEKAYAQLLGNKNEVVYVVGGDTSVVINSGAGGLVWAKNYTHLIGLCAPTALGQRARITSGVSTALMTPLITFSGHGNIISNIEFANTGSHATTAAVCILVLGARNAFLNCQFAGGLGALNVGAAMRSLVIGASTPTAAGENYFGHCYIGADTNARTAASSEIEILGGSARTVFENCLISTYATGSGTGAFFLKIGPDGIDRFCLFKQSQFMNAFTLSGGVLLADAFSLDAACGGQVMLTGCLISGATATSATKTDLYFDNIYGSTTTAKALVAGW